MWTAGNLDGNSLAVSNFGHLENLKGSEMLSSETHWSKISQQLSAGPNYEKKNPCLFCRAQGVCSDGKNLNQHEQTTLDTTSTIKRYSKGKKELQIKQKEQEYTLKEWEVVQELKIYQEYV